MKGIEHFGNRLKARSVKEKSPYLWCITPLVMDAIRINVNKQLDGYSFSITPSIRDLIRKLLPNAHPANTIFVGYDTKSNFEVNAGKLESHIYPALLGVDSQSDLNQLDEIQFIDAQTGQIIYTVTPRDEKI
jgi:hypothetical protein